MFNASELTWADIKSTPIPGKQYLEKDQRSRRKTKTYVQLLRISTKIG